MILGARAAIVIESAHNDLLRPDVKHRPASIRPVVKHIYIGRDMHRFVWLTLYVPLAGRTLNKFGAADGGNMHIRFTCSWSYSKHTLGGMSLCFFWVHFKCGALVSNDFGALKMCVCGCIESNESVISRPSECLCSRYIGGHTLCRASWSADGDEVTDTRFDSHRHRSV